MTRYRSSKERIHLAICLTAALVAAGICGYVLSLPSVLFGVHGVFGSADGYDDGVYLAVALRLIHGSLPYRDYVLVQPPGIGLLMTPVAALGQAFGDRAALAIARIVTLCFVGADAFLVGWLLRYRGKAAAIVGSLLFACFPLALAATSTLTLEPYLLFFCLLGAAFIFRNGTIGTTRQIFCGGLAFGFAGAIKLWAILPVVALVVSLVPRWKAAVRPLALGAFFGFVIPVLPFAGAAPSSFIHDVFATQLTRAANGAGGTGGAALSLGDRLMFLTGTAAMPNLQAPAEDAEVIGVLLAICIAFGVMALRRRHLLLERFVVVSAVVVVGGMFLPHDFYDHYTYFPAVFLALFIGAFVGRLRASFVPYVDRFLANKRRTRAVVWLGVPVLLFTAVAVTLVQQETSYAKSYLGDSFDYNAQASALIAPGSCVVTDFTSLVVDLNRFSTTANCPDDVDPLGIFLADDSGAVPPAPSPIPPAMVDHFFQNLLQANYVVLAHPTSDYLPWTSSLIGWFALHYRPIFSDTGTYIYLHTSDFAPATTSVGT